jgi:microcystin-dependent protein
MAMLGTGFDPAAPADNDFVSVGAAAMRDIKSRLKEFVAVSFDPETGEILDTGGGIPTPGAAGTILTSAGPSADPVWSPSPAMPVGGVIMWALDTLPSGWLWCRGGAFNIADYPALGVLLGTTYGGDGALTFGVPDLRGRAPVGSGTGDASDATAWGTGQKKGTEGVVLNTTQIPAHTHALGVKKSTDGGDYNASGSNPNRIDFGSGITSDSAGGGLTHPNIQPSIGINFIIKT